jgi:hypothetical protein
MMKCRNCGKRLPFGVGVCDNCGAAVDWKKYIWMTAVIAVAVVLLIAALIGILSREPEDKPEESTGAPTVTTGQKTPSSQTTTPQTTAKPTETNKSTETTVPPTTQPTEPVYDTTWLEYNRYSDTYIVIRFNENSEYDYPGRGFDYSGLQKDALYAVDDGDVYLITEQYATDWFVTSEHVYYVLRDEAKRVYRTDHYGQNCTVMYESAYGDVTHLQYHGTDQNGKLIMAEEYNRIVIYDIISEACEVIMEAYRINSFHYKPHSVFDDSVTAHFGTADLGPVIYWNGQLSESDPENRFGYQFYFLVNCGEFWEVYPGDWLLR